MLVKVIVQQYSCFYSKTEKFSLSPTPATSSLKPLLVLLDKSYFTMN